MVVLDKGYIEMRNKYVRPLSSHTLPYSRIRNNNMKELLLSKIQDVAQENHKGYLLTFHEDDLMKALLGDIFMFYVKSVLQNHDFEQIIKNPSISPNWNIVTNYYKAFYNVSLLLRICHRGNVFFDADYKRKLEQIISIHIGERIVLDSNMFYYIEEISGVIKLRLTRSENNTHEVVWKKINEIFSEMLPLANPKSEEKMFLLSCIAINDKLSDTFPSKLRNKVNYQPIYGLEAVEKKLHPIRKSGNWVREIIGFDGKEVARNDNRIVNVYTAYAIYIEKLAYRFMQDYFEMKGRGDFILAKINSMREDKIIIPDVPFSY